MDNKRNREWTMWILEQVGRVNPYNRQADNSKDQYAIYQAGFLAAYLASLMREDPFIQRRFERHCERIGPAAKKLPKP